MREGLDSSILSSILVGGEVELKRRAAVRAFKDLWDEAIFSQYPSVRQGSW